MEGREKNQKLVKSPRNRVDSRHSFTVRGVDLDDPGSYPLCQFFQMMGPLTVPILHLFSCTLPPGDRHTASEGVPPIPSADLLASEMTRHLTKSNLH